VTSVVFNYFDRLQTESSPAPGARVSSPRAIHPLTRRRALAGATTVGLALPLLSACGDEQGAPARADDPATGSSGPTSEATTADTADPTAGATSRAPAAAAGIVSTADVPVGSGVIFADEQVVVTQPTAGDIKAFSAICTHSRCTVTDITDVITCRCHGSVFDLSTGDVLQGPAPSALPGVDFSLEGDQVVLS
jgi:Rieske Fe-S protein